MSVNSHKSVLENEEAIIIIIIIIIINFFIKIMSNAVLYK